MAPRSRLDGASQRQGPALRGAVCWPLCSFILCVSLSPQLWGPLSSEMLPALLRHLLRLGPTSASAVVVLVSGFPPFGCIFPMFFGNNSKLIKSCKSKTSTKNMHRPCLQILLTVPVPPVLWVPPPALCVHSALFPELLEGARPHKAALCANAQCRLLGKGGVGKWWSVCF